MNKEERLMASSLYVYDTDMWGEKLVKYTDLIDEITAIYNDFESRICENCKYYDKYMTEHIPDGFCTNKTIYVEEVNEDFGCNGFSQRGINKQINRSENG